jgi:hypothetical protein
VAAVRGIDVNDEAVTTARAGGIGLHGGKRSERERTGSTSGEAARIRLRLAHEWTSSGAEADGGVERCCFFIVAIEEGVALARLLV